MFWSCIFFITDANFQIVVVLLILQVNQNIKQIGSVVNHGVISESQSPFTLGGQRFE